MLHLGLSYLPAPHLDSLSTDSLMEKTENGNVKWISECRGD